jgi:hypothetical protein
MPIDKSNEKYYGKDDLQELIDIRAEELNYYTNKKLFGLLSGDTLKIRDLNNAKKLQLISTAKQLKPARKTITLIESHDTFVWKVLDHWSSVGLNRNKMLAVLCRLWLHAGFAVYEITCQKNDKMYVGVCRIDNMYEPDYVLNSKVLENGPLHEEIKAYGISEFSHRVLAYFSSAKEAIIYKDFLLNFYLNNGGKVLYNSEITSDKWPRYLIIIMDNKIAKKIVSFCANKGITLKNLFIICIKNYMAKISGYKNQED